MEKHHEGNVRPGNDFDLLAALGTDLPGDFSPPTGRDDEFSRGSPGTPDPRENPPAAVRSKDLFEPDRHIDTLKVKSRNFH
jgi:error-prone DNA polymerase